MADYYFDSSAIAKRYLTEVGSQWVVTLLADAAHRVVTAGVTGPEVIATIVRRARAGTLPGAQLLLQRFRSDFGVRYLPVEVDPQLIAAAIRLAEKHALRGYDAVHLAAALGAHANWAIHPSSFALVSADIELNTAAQAEGLFVEDPNAYP